MFTLLCRLNSSYLAAQLAKIGVKCLIDIDKVAEMAN